MARTLVGAAEPDEPVRPTPVRRSSGRLSVVPAVAPVRVAGIPGPVSVSTVAVLPGAQFSVDIAEVAPVLVADLGYLMLRFTLPVDRATLDDVRLVDGLADAVAAWRTALIATM